MSELVDFEEKKCVHVLEEMYNAQKTSFFPDDALPKVMDKLNLSEEEAIEYVKGFLEKEFLKTSSFKPAYFLRPGYIQCFPVTVTSKGLTWLKSKGMKD